MQCSQQHDPSLSISKRGLDVPYLPPDDSNVKPIEQSADLTKALNDKSAIFAIGAFHDRAILPLHFGRRRIAAWRS